MNRIRLVIADDSEPTRYLLQDLLKLDYLIVASVGDGQAAVEAARQFKPELVLLDISMPILDGFEAAKQIKELCPSTPLIFISDHSETVYIEAAFSFGGSGYVVKSKMIAELVPAIGRVLAGEEYGRPIPARCSRL